MTVSRRDFCGLLISSAVVPKALPPMNPIMKTIDWPAIADKPEHYPPPVIGSQEYWGMIGGWTAHAQL